MMMKKIFYLLYTLVLVSATACKKFVNVNPTGQTTKAITFENVENATSAVNGMYFDLSTQGNIYCSLLYTNISLMADELKTVNAAATPFAVNSVTPQLLTLTPYWHGYYAMINHANLVLDNLSSVPGLSGAQMASWKAEAKFIRAIAYMGLVQLFGKVPKVTSSAWRDNEDLPRSPVPDIYALIGQDLKEAAGGLPHDYGDPAKDRIRATKGAANALLVKYYMLQKDWNNAVASATAVINDSSTYQLESSYANIFTDNSVESILELWYSSQTPSLLSSSFGASRGRGSVPQYGPSDEVLAAFAASTNDDRAAISIGHGTVNKYPTTTSRSKVLRLGDIYLLRAEAECQLNQLTNALADLNVIRTRAKVDPSTAADQASLLLAIENERYLELAFEGQRWFDLVRTSRADAVLGPLKPSTWQSTDVLLPVPQSEINVNPALLPQNPPF
jgi:starch-binding outer membrane protein, SusD/RagB family